MRKLVTFRKVPEVTRGASATVRPVLSRREIIERLEAERARICASSRCKSVFMVIASCPATVSLSPACAGNPMG
jgi:hypothetical protein